MRKHPIGELFREAKPFPEMLSVVTDPNLEVFQVTTDLEAAGNTRCAFFNSDGSRFFFARHWPQGRVGMDGLPVDVRSTNVEFTLCEARDGFALRVLTDDVDPRAPFVSHDDRYFYYFANQPRGKETRIVFKRVDLKTFKVEMLTVFDSMVPGIGRKPRLVTPQYQSSLRADGAVVCTGFNFETEDGSDHFAPVFVDLKTLSVRGFDWEPYSWRVGGVYYRGSDPAHLRHLMMGRCNRSQHWDKNDNYSEKWYSEVHRGLIHIVDEEGSIAGTVPIDGEQENTSHMYWRGGKYEIATHTGRFDTAPNYRSAIMCAEPLVCEQKHWASPRDIPGARRVELTRHFTRPDVCHMSWDPSGMYAACDTEGWHGRGTPCLQGPAAFLYLATVVEDGKEDPHVVTKYLLHPRSSWNHAFTENCQELSPDLKTIFFNSDWCCRYGSPQVFVARGYTFPKA
jgi:hypothetical protein